jgi:hypothetical protein
MLSKEKTELLKNVISTMDSFQQDYGNLRYSVNISSYVSFHTILVNIFNTSSTVTIQFCITEQDKSYLYELFNQKTKMVLGGENYV